MRLYHAEGASYGGTDPPSRFGDYPLLTLPFEQVAPCWALRIHRSSPGIRTSSRNTSSQAGVTRRRYPASSITELTKPQQDDELGLMMDAYHIHLQLLKSMLISRYILLDAGSRVEAPGGVRAELATYSCLLRDPNSPLPEGLYGGNTDTVMGHNHWSPVRQRFMNSGYVLGPVDAMHRMFAEAWKEIEERPETDPFDDGQRFSADFYHGSDQSVFALMYGRQEWVREKLRLKHAPPGTKPRTSKVFGKGNPYEFGIYLDFWSEFGHQTINSEWDAGWITYDKQKPIEEQVGFRSVWDCPTKVPDVLPDDILNSSLPAELLNDTRSSSEESSPWLTRPLYTHLCLSQIPVFRHMNGHKEHRENDWLMIWYQPKARAMLKDLKELLGKPSEPRRGKSTRPTLPSLLPAAPGRIKAGF
ncbi:hypothetical protein DL767_001059 [Monosporascus sp. MG133]|nr:hypothetical protein DL767_001059 [Monosporascus sp. MG133]